MVALQRIVGNQALLRSLDRGAPTAGPVIQRKTDKEKFQAKTYKLKGFVPSTGIGNFDVEYSPKTGAMKVIMKLHFDFTDVDVAYRSMSTNQAQMKWKAAQKKEWVREFEQQVMSVWGNISDIKCQKPGWEDVIAKPRIVLKQVGKGSSNFNVKVDKSFVGDTGKMRTATGSTSVGGLDREKEAAFQEQDNKDKINDDRVKNHLALAERNINIAPAFQRDQERLVAALGKMRDIVFRPGSAVVDGGMATSVANAAAAIVALRKDSALAKLHPIKLTAGVATGEAVTLGAQRFQAVKDILVNAGVENTLVSEVVQNSSPRVKYGRSDDAGVLDQYQANWKRLTVAHEFGHMLGLLDEYCPAVSPELIQMMIDEGKLDQNFVMSGPSQGRVAQDSAKQTEYAKMLKSNDLETPTYARPTAQGQEKSTSLMSGGFEIMKQHYVTIWEALGTATTPTLTKDQWKIG